MNPPLETRYDRLAQRCANAVGSGWFQYGIAAVIVANAIVIGMQTYPNLEAQDGALLATLNDAFLGVFTVELTIRIIAYGRNRREFFRNGWNLFDFIVVGAAFLPWVRTSVTLLRVTRLLRISRLLTVLPGIRIVVRGIGRSLVPIAGLTAFTVFLIYLYGMLGWILFSDHDPERFGTIGSSMLTLFQVLTLEGWNEVLATEMESSQWAWIYFVSFVLIATFIVLNVVIAIIINSMDEVRAIEEEQERLERLLAGDDGEFIGGSVEARVRAVRVALNDLERDLLRGGATPER